MKHFNTLLYASVCALAGAAAHASDAASVRVALRIEPQPVRTALKQLSDQAGVQVLLRVDNVSLDTVVAPEISGEMTLQAALNRLLKDSGLEYEFVNDRTIRISAAASDPANPNAPSNSGAAPQSSQGRIENSALLEDGASIQEIIVTAQKRSERLQDVPVPVTAINTNALAAGGQVLVRDYYTRIPNLSFTPGTQSAQVLTLRGISTGRGNPTVGIMIDDVPYAASSGIGGGEVVPDIDPGDLARVEVLRGPQGTLYGASSMGGLLKFVTVDPSPDAINGRVQVGSSTVQGGAELGYFVRGAVNVPLSGSAAVRLSGFHRQDPGYIDNLQTGQKDVNSADANGGRASLLWNVSDALSVRASALIQQIDGDGTNETHTGAGLGDMQQRTLLGTGWYERKAEAYSLTVAADLGRAELTSISGYSNNGYSGSLDQSYSFGALMQPLFGVGGADLVNDNATRKYTQELRLVLPLGPRAELLAAAFYTNEDSFITQTVLAKDAASGAAAGRYLHLIVPTTYSDFAVFADLTYKFTERFDIQLGGRQSWLRQSFEQTQINALAGAQESTTITPRIVTEPNVFTYLVTPRFRVSPTLMLYARMASGYRAGGTNAGVDVPLVYAPDQTENYELGIKGSFLEQKLSIDASVYYIDWTDLQLAVRPGAYSYTINGSRAESNGVELAIEAYPWDGFTVQATGAWNDARIAKDFPADAARTAFAADGDRLPWSSRWSGSLSLEQSFGVGANVEAFVGGTLSHVGERQGIFRPAAAPARQQFPSYSRIDLRLGLRTGDWVASAFANNLANERGLLWGGIGAVPPFGYYYIQPRTIGVSVTRSF